MQDLNKFKNEMNLSGQNVYVGHRYVPKIMGDWDNTQIYEPLSIVQYQGNSFTSRQYVPSGVEITNEEFWASTGNYNAQVEQYRQDVVNLGNDIKSFNDDIVEITNGHNSNVKMLNTLGVYAVNFGVKANDESVDNHDGIMQAVDYASTNNYSYVLLPAGIVTTSPFSLKEYRHITLVGTASNYYADQSQQKGTTLKFISEGEVGVQLNDVTNPDGSTDWRTVSNRLKDIKIDCNNLVDTGVNGAFDFSLERVYVVKARLDGITLEATTYPANITNVYSTYNGRHGIYVKAPNTTVYNVKDSEFSRNDGYGIYIESGATVSYDNVVTQSNKQGGVKIVFPDVTNFTLTNWLNNIIFNNLYTENNGLLDVSNPNYEGNFAVVITSESGNPSNVPRNIKFVNSSINQSANGKTIKITHANTVYIDASFSNQAIFEIDTDKEKVKGVTFSKKADEYLANIAPTQVNTFKTFEPRYAMGVQTQGGFYGSRGRNSILYFGYKDLENSGSQYGVTNANLPAEDGLSNTIYYPMIAAGSILRVSAKKLGNVTNPTGSLEIQIYIDDVLATTVNGTEAVLPWSLATDGNNLNKNYAPSELSFNSGSILKVRLVSKGHQNGTSDYNAYSIGLLIEV